MGAGNVLTGSLAWYFATTQKTITTPLTFNRPFASDSKSVDATGLTQFAASFIYWRLNVTPENIEHNQKMILGFVPSAERDVLKKALDIETERIQKAGITTQFDTKEIRVMDDGSVQYSGVLKSSTTNGAIITPLKDQEKTYRLKLSYDNAAAVFLAAGLFTSGLRAASAPAAIPFENDAAFNVTLSNTNPSKVVVDGELITSISGPTGAYDQSQTEDGALILSPLVGQNFTLFIQTDHGSSLSLNVRPQPGNGKTLRFTPMSPPLRKNDDAKAWEEGQTYEKTLVALSRAVVNGQVPDDYQEYPISRMPAYTPASDVRLTPERQFVGNHLRVVRFRMSNPGSITRSLRERDFWRKGVRAVMLSQNQLYAGGEGYAWIVFSDDGDARP
ncbi:hypothetical protein L1887_43554 [Cichorium endivia]|nr:hypothetical protein L1887_43554 [Cichorium endivia]